MRKMKVISMFVLLALLLTFVPSMVIAAEPPPPEAQLGSDIDSSGFSKVLIDDSQFVFSSDLFKIDFFALISKKAPILDEYKTEYHGEVLAASSILVDIAHYYSINPVVLLSILEIQGGLISSAQPEDLQYVAGYRVEDARGFATQLEWLSKNLTERYYSYSGKGEINAATYAITSFLSSITTRGTATSSKDQRFVEIYTHLLGDPLKAYSQNVVMVMSQPYMELPWSTGHKMYYTGGPHYSGGGSPRPWSAVDFAPGGGSGCNWVSYEAIRASRRGTVVYVGPHGSSDPWNVKIDHRMEAYEEPWVTYYYHLRGIPNTVQEGTYVTTGCWIGYPSCQPPESSSGVHLHLSFIYDGNFVNANGKQLSGWAIYEGAAAYAGTMCKNGATKTASTFKVDGENDIVK